MDTISRLYYGYGLKQKAESLEDIGSYPLLMKGYSVNPGFIGDPDEILMVQLGMSPKPDECFKAMALLEEFAERLSSAGIHGNQWAVTNLSGNVQAMQRAVDVVCAHDNEPTFELFSCPDAMFRVPDGGRAIAISWFEYMAHMVKHVEFPEHAAITGRLGSTHSDMWNSWRYSNGVSSISPNTYARPIMEALDFMQIDCMVPWRSGGLASLKHNFKSRLSEVKLPTWMEKSFEIVAQVGEFGIMPGHRLDIDAYSLYSSILSNTLDELRVMGIWVPDKAMRDGTGSIGEHEHGR